MTGMMDECVIAILDCEAAPAMTGRAAREIVRAIIDTISEPPDTVIDAADEKGMANWEYRISWYRALLAEIVK